MAHFTLRSLTLTGFLLLAGCSGLPDMADETAGWSAQKLYTEAKESMGDGAWERAIKMFEKLEARYPYGRYAQQAQLEVAYAYYKSNEQASAVAACASGGMDISDGLVGDLAKMAAASGVGIEIDADSVPLSEAARAASSWDRARVCRNVAARSACSCARAAAFQARFASRGPV